MAEWAPERDETRADDPGYWRRMTLTMSPRVRNFGRLDGPPDERAKKAETVLAWSRSCIDKDLLVEIERSQFDDIEQAWEDAVVAEKER
ncbi:hypothetical protein [Haloarcula amylovorans]|uniref:hypothetical protein n=1 Tax=Haloarcula amylovorans TaxID=2562280 RepID=UPI001FD7A886|nr:hypothetical protein [Halomicroarcula amylolytica]